MKKVICLILALAAMLSCLTACRFSQNASGAMAGKAESAPKAEEMMASLAAGSISDAKALMHPQVAENADQAIAQMSAYLAGRKTSAMEQKSITVNTSTGTAGNSRQERVAYQVTLSDGAVIYINSIYLSDKLGTGFVSFQLILGVV